MSCTRCNGVGLIRVLRTVTKLYGAPRHMTFTRPCPGCNGTGKVPNMIPQDHKSLAANDNR